MLNTILGAFSSGVPPVTGSFESIASATGTGASATISFNSIPGTYQHLQIRGAFIPDSLAPNKLYIRFNSDTGNNYATHWLRGSGGTVEAGGAATQSRIRVITAPVNNDVYPNPVLIDIHDYISSTKNKTVRSYGGFIDPVAADDAIELTSGLWMNTAAVTSIQISCDAFFTTATQFALYGIKGA